jgi:hypothetical protein
MQARQNIDINKVTGIAVDFHKGTLVLYVTVGLRQKLFSVLFSGSAFGGGFVIPDLEFSGVVYFSAHYALLCLSLERAPKGGAMLGAGKWNRTDPDWG